MSFPYRTRGGNHDRGEEPTSSSLYALLADEVNRSLRLVVSTATGATISMRCSIVCLPEAVDGR